LPVLPCSSSSRTVRVSPDERKHTSIAASPKVKCRTNESICVSCVSSLSLSGYIHTPLRVCKYIMHI
jgi:hypothetical protein